MCIYKGAENIYKVFIRPTLKQHEKDIDAQIEHYRKQAEKYPYELQGEIVMILWDDAR